MSRIDAQRRLVEPSSVKVNDMSNAVFIDDEVVAVLIPVDGVRCALIELASVLGRR